MRRKLEAPPLDPPRTSVKFVNSGSVMLNLVLSHTPGGGWAQGRVVNIVGDRSSGKTLLAIEATANYAAAGDPQRVRYAEAESALDDAYALRIGMPGDIQRTKDNEIATVEQFAADFLAFADKLNGDKPALYVLDSLDALSDAGEMERDLGDATYGTARAKLLSEFFRKHVGLISTKNITLMVISQIRDKIGVTFGETKTRSGGRALDFYASQIVWLAETGKLKRTAKGVERVIGLQVQARTKKNKTSEAFREAVLDIIFNYGVDDEMSMLNWLKKHKALDLLNSTDKQLKDDIETARSERDREALAEINRALREACSTRWSEVEELLAPPMSKYGD